MRSTNTLKNDERGISRRLFLGCLVVVMTGVIGLASWAINGNGIKAKAAGFFEVQDTAGVYVGACKVNINEDSNQIGLKVVNSNETAAAMQTKTYGSGVVIKTFSVPAGSTAYPTRYITTQSTIVISTNGSNMSVPIASLPGC